MFTLPISFSFLVGYQGHLGVGGPHLCAGEDASSQRQAPRGHEVLQGMPAEAHNVGDDCLPPTPPPAANVRLPETANSLLHLCRALPNHMCSDCVFFFSN